MCGCIPSCYCFPYQVMTAFLCTTSHASGTVVRHVDCAAGFMAADWKVVMLLLGRCSGMQSSVMHCSSFRLPVVQMLRTMRTSAAAAVMATCPTVAKERASGSARQLPGSSPAAKPKPAQRDTTLHARYDQPGHKSSCALICLMAGACQCWRLPSHPYSTAFHSSLSRRQCAGLLSQAQCRVV